MQIIAKTDVGLVRHENQDRVKYKELDKDVYLVIVCDGMGGENAGGEASEVAVNIIFDRIISGFRNQAENNSIRNLILTSINAANSVVFEKSISEDNKFGMGTTCVCGIIKNNIAYIANVGDSRAYLISDNKITQITDDHTYVKLLFDQGKISEDEISSHPQRNVITRAIGIEEQIEIDYFEIDLNPQSKLLICSDGLSTYCTDELILEVVDNNSIEIATEKLIDCANNQGGKDNITVALLAN